MKKILTILTAAFAICLSAAAQEQVTGPYHNMYSNKGAAISEIAPYAKYKTLKESYNYKDYNRMPDDKYSTAWSGVASFFIPGLGQMICDEVGRGFAWLGTSIGCQILTGIGSAMITGTFYGYDPDFENNGTLEVEINGATTMGMLLFSAGLLGTLAVDISAIVDAVRVAKVKNMFEQDKKASHTLNVSMYPSVNYAHTPTGVQPAAGLTLAMRF